MLQALEIKHFRVLEDFKVGKLGRVNLIVGKNNSGKSSILEALQIRFVSFNELADAWDQISLTDNEVVVSDALKLITPEFEKLSFIKASESGIPPQGVEWLQKVFA